MSRIAPAATSRAMMMAIERHNERIEKESRAVSSGYKVFDPGDSEQSGTISRFREMISRVAAHQDRLGPIKSMLTFQDEVLKQANESVTRALEIATQGANETVSPEIREQMAEEVYQLRDQLVTLANSTYQGRYIYGGTDDDDPPFDAVTPYAIPASGRATERYTHDAEAGTGNSKSAPITDDLTITISTPGNQLFSNAITALERLGRALSGYRTNPPDASNAAYTMPAEFAEQTAGIKATIDSLKSAREDEIMPEQISLAGRLRRVEIADSVLSLTKSSGQESLSRLQEADVFESASALTSAQSALEASLTITSRILGTSLMDYL